MIHEITFAQRECCMNVQLAANQCFRLDRCINTHSQAKVFLLLPTLVHSWEPYNSCTKFYLRIAHRPDWYKECFAKDHTTVCKRLLATKFVQVWMAEHFQASVSLPEHVKKWQEGDDRSFQWKKSVNEVSVKPNISQVHSSSSRIEQNFDKDKFVGRLNTIPVNRFYT